ncbi:MAG: response regulator transcription factor [Anaerolineae bacterium]|nr:response regulator transcription factor [Anaerolineae bacterium]
MKRSERIEVILADDHAVVRQGIRDFLEEPGDIAVVAEASTGEEALVAIREHQPDVAVLDIQMPDRTGLDVTRTVRAEQLPVGVLVLTAYDDDPFIVTALQAGANGYVLKTAEPEEIVAAVRAVHEGQSALDPAIVSKVMSQLTGGPRPGLVEPLSARELEVLRLAAQGYTNKGIGVQLNISDRTVQGHLASVYGKLAVGNRTEAVTRSIQLGLISAG